LRRAVVARVAYAVLVPVGLLGVGGLEADVTGVPYAVSVPVALGGRRVGVIVAVHRGIRELGADVEVVIHAVSVEVQLTCVADAVSVLVTLLGACRRVTVAVRSRVGHVPAVVADVAHAVPPTVVAVAVLLERVGDGGAVVAGVTHLVAVPVILCRIGDVGAQVAEIPHAVPVRVALLVGSGGVPVAVLGQVEERGAQVAGATQEVAVQVELVGVVDPGAVVEKVGHPVPVGVRIALVP